MTDAPSEVSMMSAPALLDGKGSASLDSKGSALHDGQSSAAPRLPRTRHHIGGQARPARTCVHKRMHADVPEAWE